jgi:Tfp pilus assembly protein FimT
MEMLVVVAMIGICSTIAVGSFRRIHQKSISRAAVEDLLAVLQKTHSDAANRQRHTGVAITADSTVSITDVSGVSHYGLKYIVFVDAESAGTPDLFDSQDTLVGSWTQMGKTFAYSTSSSGLSGGVASIVFHTDGSSANDLSMTLGIADFTDTFRLSLLPATGLATLER